LPASWLLLLSGLVVMGRLKRKPALPKGMEGAAA
jgi:hypothetical protein